MIPNSISKPKPLYGKENTIAQLECVGMWDPFVSMWSSETFNLKEARRLHEWLGQSIRWMEKNKDTE